MASRQQPSGTQRPTIASCSLCPCRAAVDWSSHSSTVGSRVCCRRPKAVAGAEAPCKGGFRSHRQGAQWRPKVKSQKSVIDVGRLGGAEQQFLKIQPQAQSPDPGTSWARLKQVPRPMLPADGALTLGRALAWGGQGGESCWLCPLYSFMAGLVTCGRA